MGRQGSHGPVLQGGACTPPGNPKSAHQPTRKLQNTQGGKLIWGFWGAHRGHASGSPRRPKRTTVCHPGLKVRLHQLIQTTQAGMLGCLGRLTCSEPPSGASPGAACGGVIAIRRKGNARQRRCLTRSAEVVTRTARRTIGETVPGRHRLCVHSMHCAHTQSLEHSAAQGAGHACARKALRI